MLNGIVLLTMAGRSERFARVGVRTPKWALELGGKTMLEHAVASVAPLLENGAELRLIVRPDDADSPELRDIVDVLPWRTCILSASGKAEGQAIDALGGLRPADDGRPCAIWCVDTIVDWDPETAATLAAADGNWLLTAPLAGDHWSFADADAHGEVTATAERCRIGDDASVGMYAFARGGLLRECVERSGTEGLLLGERYVAPLYNLMVRSGERVRVVRIAADAVTPVGTPDELLAACAARGWATPHELEAYSLSSSRMEPSD
jgi:hypothetical protein